MTMPSNGGIAHAAPLANLQKKLAEEQNKAEKRRSSLQRLTDQERKLNTSLASTENKILEAEKHLEELQNRIRLLAKTDDEAVEKYDEIQKQREETLAAQSSVMLLLWELEGKRTSVGGREMFDWAEVDREYQWSKDLLKELEHYQATLNKQKKELDDVLAQREQLSKQVRSNVNTVNRTKEQLLTLQLSYSKQLSSVRKELSNTEKDLTNILKIVNNLNLAIEKAGGDIARLKGKLPWPVKGKLTKKYSPNADPPFRGIGITTADGQAVTAVASGKVVHNGVLRGLGTVLIVQHGSEYYTVYAYLSGSPLAVGKEVNRQERIGTVGFIPELDGSGLYFELRFGQKAINPEQWLSSK